MEIPSFFVPFGGEGYWKFRMSSIGGGGGVKNAMCHCASSGSNRLDCHWLKALDLENL